MNKKDGKEFCRNVKIWIFFCIDYKLNICFSCWKKICKINEKIYITAKLNDGPISKDVNGV